MAEFFVRKPKTRQTHLDFKIPFYFFLKSVYASNVIIVNGDGCPRDNQNNRAVGSSDCVISSNFLFNSLSSLIISDRALSYRSIRVELSRHCTLKHLGKLKGKVCTPPSPLAFELFHHSH